jgi:hypothetical protein
MGLTPPDAQMRPKIHKIRDVSASGLARGLWVWAWFGLEAEQQENRSVSL